VLATIAVVIIIIIKKENDIFKEKADCVLFYHMQPNVHFPYALFHPKSQLSFQ
jgi:hypothetical protein